MEETLNIIPGPNRKIQRHCKYFSTGGKCNKKRCRFIHDQELRDQALRDMEANRGEMTLAQRSIVDESVSPPRVNLKAEETISQPTVTEAPKEESPTKEPKEREAIPQEAASEAPKSEAPSEGPPTDEARPLQAASEAPKEEPPAEEIKPENQRLRSPKPKVEPRIKEDPDAPEFVSTHNLGRRPRVKPEPQEPSKVTIDLSLPEAGDDMFEDVDAEEVVDLTYAGIAQVDGVEHFVCEGFKIRRIRDPFIVKRSLYDLYQCIEAKSIILDPEYQRDVVWDEGRAALLMTSILMGYFIPPIIFNVKKTTVKVEGREEVRYTRICVDGKQRMTSIWKFFKGQIGFYDNSTPQRKWFYCHEMVNGRLQVSTRNVLPSAVKEYFKKQFYCCYEYEELDQDTEETMFQLVQRGVTLTPAEKMRAMSGEWAAFTKQYEDDYSLVVNLHKQIRGSGFRLVLTIFAMVLEVADGRLRKIPNTDLSAPVLQASPKVLTRLLEDPDPIEEDVKTKLKAIFERYERLVKVSSTRATTTRWEVNSNSAFDPAPDYLRHVNINWTKSYSPVELIGTAILIQIHMNNRTDEEFLEDIKAMRMFLRDQHRDLRVNSGCWNNVWLFITEKMDERMGLPTNSTAAAAKAASNTVPNKILGRRKRQNVVEDGEEEAVDEDDDESSDLSSLSSTESDESDGIMFEGLMPPRNKLPAKSASKMQVVLPGKAKTKRKQGSSVKKNIITKRAAASNGGGPSKKVKRS